MNILAAVEKRPGRSRISLDSITVSIIIKRISNFHQLSLIVIWYDVHYVITLPLHRYICDDIRAGSPWGRATDGILISDSDLIWISHSSLLTHSLSGTSQPADHGTIEEIPHPPVNPKTWAVQREASCLFSLANTGRTNWCLKVSWITGERAGRRRGM